MIHRRSHIRLRSGEIVSKRASLNRKKEVIIGIHNFSV